MELFLLKTHAIMMTLWAEFMPAFVAFVLISHLVIVPIILNRLNQNEDPR